MDNIVTRGLPDIVSEEGLGLRRHSLTVSAHIHNRLSIISAISKDATNSSDSEYLAGIVFLFKINI